MVSFNQFLKTVLLAVVYASATGATPFPSNAKHATHRVREVGQGLKIETYHPVSTFETFGAGIDHPLSKRDNPDLEESAVAFIQSKLRVAKDAIAFTSGFSGEVAKHAFLKQSHDGVPFANAVANVAFNHNNKVVSFGSSFVKPTKIASSTPSILLKDAITKAEAAVDGTHNDHPPTLEYLVMQEGSVALTHVIQIQNEEKGTWVEAFIDAHTGELRSITDFVNKASYRVVPITSEVPVSATGVSGFETLTDPQDTIASPLGWHNDGTTTTTTTAGNNAIAFKGSQSSLTSQSSAPLNFVYPADLTLAPTSVGNVNAARVNAFYLVNSVHDLSYRYGFTEAAYNFQNNNFGKGGRGNDRVIVSVQSSAGTNNADFTTPPDGQSGSMRVSDEFYDPKSSNMINRCLSVQMYLFTLTQPQRDGALENDVVVHENTHGITNRMTGGGTARCLQTTEAGGMGEGWSDAMADWTEKTTSAVPDYIMGQYVVNSPAGIRSHPYSTSVVVNPYRYSTIASLHEVHDIGEVWANMLHNVYAALVAVHGFSITARTNPNGTEGNVVFLHLFIDALALQPCNPTLPTARDAWIQADANRYGGANTCTLWRAFASRGLGVGAANHRDSTAVPTGC